MRRLAPVLLILILVGCVAAPERRRPEIGITAPQSWAAAGVASDAPVERWLTLATPPAGDFECSHPLVNRLWKNALWGQKGNFLSVPTDCPQRDERLGWMGDAQVFLRTAAYNMDVVAFFTKWMVDVTDSQDVDGVFPDVAPRLREGDNFCGLDGLGGSAGWADAGGSGDVDGIGERFVGCHAGDESGEGNRVAADIEDAAAAQVRVQKPAFGIVFSRKAKGGADEFYIADNAGPEIPGRRSTTPSSFA